MAEHNAGNERVKRQYFTYLKEPKRHSEPTVDAVAKALSRFEADAGYRDFKAFHFEQAIAFKKRLADQQSMVTGEKLSKATLHATLAHLKRFFQWLVANRATGPVSGIPTRTISTYPTKTRGLRRHVAKNTSRPWSRLSTSLRRCRTTLRSSSEIVPLSLSPSLLGHGTAPSHQ